MNAPSWVEMQTARDADRLSDALNREARIDHKALMAMAQEKVCQDLSLFSGFLAVATTDPCEVEACEFFGPIATDRLIREILMKPQATDKQLAEGWKEVRRRFLAEYPETVQRTYQELLENAR